MAVSADERLVVMLEARISEFEKRMAKAERTGSDSYRRLRRGSQSATQGMEQDMIRSTNRINQALASTSTKIGSYGKAMAAGLVAGGFVAAVTAGTATVRAFAAEIATVGDEARRAGLSAKAFQEWRFVAEQNRIGVDALVDGFKELSLRADEFILTGAGSGAEAFQRLGYGAEELREKLKDPSALMLEVIGRLQQLDKAAQIRIADELFGGTGGERFVELLAQGEDGIRRTIDRANELGAVMDDELIAKAAEVDRQFNAIATTVGTALKSAIVSAASSLADFMDGFRAFENQRTSTLQARQSEIMREKAELNQRIGKNVRGDGKTSARIAELDAEENQIIGQLSARTPAWTPKADTWTAPTPSGAAVPTKRSGGSSRGAGARSGGASRPDEYQAAAAGIREQTAALDEQTEAFAAAEASNRDYADAMDYAKARADLMTAAQRAGIAITPQLEAEIEGLANAYTLAGQRAEEAAERMQKIEDQGKRGAAAVSDVFLAATEGAGAAKQALGQLLQEMARAAAMRGFAGLAGAGGATGSIFSALGGLLSYDGGGSTGMGARSGGLDGKGGFLAMLHPRETVVDHTRGQTAGGGQMKVDVGVSVDDHGNLQAYVKSVAQSQAQAAVDKAAPNLVRQSVGAVQRGSRKTRKFLGQ